MGHVTIYGVAGAKPGGGFVPTKDTEYVQKETTGFLSQIPATEERFVEIQSTKGFNEFLLSATNTGSMHTSQKEVNLYWYLDREGNQLVYQELDVTAETKASGGSIGFKIDKVKAPFLKVGVKNLHTTASTTVNYYLRLF